MEFARAIVSRGGADAWPEVEFLDMPVDDGPIDTVCAVERMAACESFCDHCSRR